MLEPLHSILIGELSKAILVKINNNLGYFALEVIREKTESIEDCLKVEV